MTTQTKKKQAKQYFDQSPIEAFRDLGGGVAKSVASDFVQDSASTLWGQMLGVGEYGARSRAKVGGELAEGEELDLQALKQNSEKTQEIEAGIDYRREILRGSERSTHIASKETESQIQEILVAIKQLASSTKTLSVQFKEVVVEQRIENVGKYHVTFFEWVLTTLRVAKMRVEESSSWLAVFKSKKKQQQYWGMFKKHGTTFGLSNERVVSTQTG